MGFHNRSIVNSVSMMKTCRIQRFRFKSNRDLEAKPVSDCVPWDTLSSGIMNCTFRKDIFGFIEIF